jgi:hypothetical protein
MSDSTINKAENFEEKEAELHADLEDVVANLEDEKAEAVAALGEAAEESLETREVRLSDELVLTVKERIDPRAERLQERAENAQEKGDMEGAARHAAQALAHQVIEPEEYTDTEVWEVAVEQYGKQFVLVDCTEKILGPAMENATEVQKKFTQ